MAEVTQKWRALFSTLPLPYTSLPEDSYQIRWNGRMRSRAGVCRPRLNLIELNPHLLKDRKAFEEVLVHELCHLAISRRWPTAGSHGLKWKKLMTRCGFEPLRYHSLIPHKRFTQKRWSLNCRCGTHEVTTRIYNRIQRGFNYRCLKCRETLTSIDRPNIWKKVSDFLGV